MGIYGTRDQLTFRVWPPSDEPLYWLILVLVLLPVVWKGVFERRRKLSPRHRDGGSRRQSTALSGRRNSELSSHETSSDGNGRYVYDNKAFTNSIEQDRRGSSVIPVDVQLQA